MTKKQHTMSLCLTNTIKFTHVAASVRETPAVYNTNSSTALELNWK